MSAHPARITTARQLLTQLGLTIADLYCQDTADRAVPTLAEYLPQVIAAVGPGATRTYGSYWTKMTMAWGSRALDEISATDIEAMQHQMVAAARSRRNSRHGRHAGAHWWRARQVEATRHHCWPWTNRVFLACAGRRYLMMPSS